MSEIFRDRTEGAIARRQDLLRKRRDELVTMPHAVRRVVVARAARAAASTAMIITGVGLLAAALSPALSAKIASGLPGINPAVLSSFVGAAWVLGLVAFAISRGRSEHRFAVAMSTYVLPGEDIDQDIERLSHERPDAVARMMAHRLEIGSAALPIAAAALVLPATLIYIAQAIAVKGWPSTMEYESSLAMSAKPMLYTAVAGIFAAVVMTRRSARLEAVIPFAAIGSLLAGALAAKFIFARDFTGTWAAAAVSVIAGSIAFIDWRLKCERKAIDAQDPAAGSELFTLRGLLASMRSAFKSVRRRVSTPMAIGAVAFGTLLVCAGSPIATSKGASASAASQPMTMKRPTNVIVAPTPGNSSYTTMATGDGRIRVDARFVEGKPLVLEGIGGVMYVPQGWRARVTVSIAAESSAPGSIAINPFLRTAVHPPLHLGLDATEHRFSVSACEGPVDLGLSMTPVDAWPGTNDVSFLIEPSLELAQCANDITQ